MKLSIYLFHCLIDNYLLKRCWNDEHFSCFRGTRGALSLVVLFFIGSIFFGITTGEDLENGMKKRWYLRPDDTTIYYDPERAPVVAILHFLTALSMDT